MDKKPINIMKAALRTNALFQNKVVKLKNKYSRKRKHKNKLDE